MLLRSPTVWSYSGCLRCLACSSQGAVCGGSCCAGAATQQIAQHQAGCVAAACWLWLLLHCMQLPAHVLVGRCRPVGVLQQVRQQRCCCERA